MEKNKILRQLIFAAIVLVFVLLRFWHLTDSCLWFDEIFGVHAAEHDWRNLFAFVAQDLIHPPLFYVLLKIWIAVGGENLFWLRLFSVLFSVVSLVPFYLLCRRLKLNYRTTALALALFAVNGSLIKYAQEIRMYSLLLCLSLVSLWLFSRFFYSGRSLAALTVLNVLLIYTHYFGWLVVCSEVVAILILQRVKLRQILIMLAIAAAAFAPWTFAVWRAAQANANFSQNLAWADKPNLRAISQFAFDLIEPFYFQPTNVDASSVFIITVPLLLIFIAAFFLYFFYDWKNKTGTEKQNFYLFSILFFAPVSFAFVASWLLPFSIWGARHLIIVFAPAAILTAIVLDRIKVFYLKLAALGLIFWLTSMAFLLQAMRGAPVSILCAWGNLAEDLRESEQNKLVPTRVFLFEDAAAYNFWFALRDRENQFQIVKVNGIEGLTEDAAYFLPRGFDAVKTADENAFDGERFYIVFRDTEWNEAKPPLKNLIEKNYKISLAQTFEAQGLKAFLVEVRRE